MEELTIDGEVRVEEIVGEHAPEKVIDATSELFPTSDEKPRVELAPAIREKLAAALITSQRDLQYPEDLRARLEAALDCAPISIDVLVEDVTLYEQLIDHSPYVEVRSVVPDSDDPNIPVGTFRAYAIGLTFAVFGTAVNVFFSARNPSIALNTFTAQILSYPIGCGMAASLPTRVWSIFGWRFTLNPGPFNSKEHMLITIMANVSFGGLGGYATDILFVQKLPVFFNDARANKIFYQISLALSTQMIGLGLAGVLRNTLVYPASMIWPASLSTIALNQSFHSRENTVANGWRMSKLRLFSLVFAAYGIYWVLPDVFVKALGTTSWITWFAPNNASLVLWCGTITGLGFNPLPSFDWNNMILDAIVTPFSAIVNLVIGMVVFGLLLIVPVYYSNVWNTKYLPINSNQLFDRFANRYNVSRVLDENFTLDPAKYEFYSEIYLSSANSLVFAAYFAVYASTLSYVFLNHRSELKEAWRSISFRKRVARPTDLHNRLMTAYPEVPHYWYLTILVLSVILAIVCQLVYSTGVPFWSVFFALGLSGVFLIPIGIIAASTNIEVTLNVLAEFVGGYAVPGNPLALMIFKAYGFVTAAQAIQYTSDLKLGHYMKLPPREMFRAQVIASVLSAFVGLLVIAFQVSAIPDMCTPGQPDRWTCPGYQTFFTSSLVWGAVGPQRLYSFGKRYSALLWAFPVGFVLPFPVYFLSKRYPKSIWSQVNVPVMISGGMGWAPFNLSRYAPALPVAWFFSVYVKGRFLPWWQKV
ncbi:uncharacterized protein L969DRAFT_82123 [Mixia osmundae IAM 14324]|uniref:uncharacterized protein n=1 Tax=Mixia osmundae (strain CBS 9802 / IAM 14324 / JCM 22182 / KY 12970) TaxID=764103 RepID=UPI0004A54885|nr:uncharacterized protein L969DRAFT_82123 [Mixia osmundae IAM 14324]KEI39260.1 hypothetical protein L969DRAFT_82123 [Mixia osmundae IAM 14324]